MRASNTSRDGLTNKNVSLGDNLDGNQRQKPPCGTPQKPRSKGKLQNRAERAYRHADPASALGKLNKSQLNSRERNTGQKSTSDVRARTVPFASARARSGATGASSRHNL